MHSIIQDHLYNKNRSIISDKLIKKQKLNIDEFIIVYHLLLG